jgi:tRNA dimethylallyltransferase
LSGASDVVDVRVICGPTAAGKSAIALWLAAQLPVTIVSADSRQVYRGFDIGTAKPRADEQRHVPHRGIDVVDPRERYSAARWADAANGWIDDARADRREPVVVGGTGLYLKALFEGLFQEPPLDPARRAALARELDRCTLDELRRWAAALDPERAHLGRTQLLRSIEIALLTGARLSALHRDRARVSRWRPRYLLVGAGPALNERIGARIDDMFEHGWPDEVQRLMQTVPADAPAWNATGYDAVRRLVAGELSREAARDQILVATRQYAKRQRTWFRHQLPADLVTIVNPLQQGWEGIVERWASDSSSFHDETAL